MCEEGKNSYITDSGLCFTTQTMKILNIKRKRIKKPMKIHEYHDINTPST